MEDKLKEWACNLMNNYCISVGDKKFHFVELEFYHWKQDGTYPRNWEDGKLFYHYSGIDIMRNFRDANKEDYWGVLIRSVEVNNTFIGGPMKVKNIILNTMTTEAPLFTQLADPKTINKEEIDSSPRIGFKEQTQKYRFVIKEKETDMPRNKDNSIRYKNTITDLNLETENHF